MPRSYEQINRLEREYIALRRRQRIPYAQIARELGRHRSTIGREVRRNRDARGSYYSTHAHQVALSRRAIIRTPKKLASGSLRRSVERAIRMYWSPEQIEGRRRLKRTVFAYALLADKKLLRRFDPDNADRWLAAFDQPVDLHAFRPALERLIRDDFVRWKGAGLDGVFEIQPFAKPETEECIKQDASFVLKIAETVTGQVPDAIIQGEVSLNEIVRELEKMVAA